MGWTAAIVAILKAASEMGGLQKLAEFLTRHRDQILQMIADERAETPLRPKGL